jgi:hypothetical protein
MAARERNSIWPNRDPMEEGGGLNLYEFVVGDPVNHIDANGLDPEVGGSWGALFTLLFGNLGNVQAISPQLRKR